MLVGPNDLLTHLIGVQTGNAPPPLHLLELIQKQPRGPSTLAEECSVSRNTIYNALNPLTESFAIIQKKNTYELTGYGAVLLRAFKITERIPSVDRSSIRFLAASRYRVDLLEELSEDPARKATLANSEAAPSRTTIHRAIKAFSERSWVRQRSDGRYELTSKGSQVLAVYTELRDAIRIAASRSEFLYCCDETVADIPVRALTDSELYVNTPEAPDITRGILRELASPNLNDFRGFLSTVSTASADVGDSIIRAGTETELVVPERVLYNLPTEGHYATHVKRGLEAQNFELFVVADIDSLPIGLAIFDDETVYMGPATIEQVPDGGNAGTIVSSAPALVEWADTLYENYRERARTPARHVLQQLWKKVSDRTSLTNLRTLHQE